MRSLAVFLLNMSCIFQVRRLTQRHLGAVVKSKRVPVGGAGRSGGLLCGGGAAAGLPPLPGLHQLHHLGVHVASQDLVPEELRGRGEPFRPRSLLQPVGLLLHLQDGGVGADLPQKHPRSCLTCSRTAQRRLNHTRLSGEENPFSTFFSFPFWAELASLAFEYKLVFLQNKSSTHHFFS